MVESKFSLLFRNLLSSEILKLYTGIVAMDVVVLDAREVLLEMYIPKIASHTTSARGSIMQVEKQGKSELYQDSIYIANKNTVM
jgi:hypothetical protein